MSVLVDREAFLGVDLAVTLPADEIKVVPGQSKSRVVYVPGVKRFDVMHDLASLDDPSAEASLAEVRPRSCVCVPAIRPGVRTIKRIRGFVSVIIHIIPP